VGGLFFLLGAAFCVAAVWLFFGDRLQAARLEEGSKARAEVLSKLIVADRTQGSFVRPKHRVEYRFVPARGDPVSATADIDPALWQRLGRGDALEVAYLPSSPAEHAVQGVQRDWVVAGVLAIVGLFFAPVGFWLARDALARREAPQGPRRAPRWIAANPPLALGSIGVLFFLPFLAGGIWWFLLASAEAEQFQTRARPVDGVVVTKEIVRKRSAGSSGSGGGSSSSTHYEATYRYRADSGEEIAGRSELGSDDWERLKERGPINITYVAGEPWRHRVAEEGGSWLGPAIFLGIGGFGMLGSGYAALRGWRRRGAPLAAQPKATPQPRLRPEPAAEGPAAQPVKRGGNWIVGVAGGVFFVAGSSLAVSGVLDLLEERRFGADGKFVQARIVDKGIQEAQRGEQRSTAYTAVYRFSTEDGRQAEGRVVLKPDAWEAAKPGDGLRVQYLPSRPEASRLEGESLWVDAIVGLLVGPLFALIGAALLLGAWMSWREPHG
jgi:hypothetical protein